MNCTSWHICSEWPPIGDYFICVSQRNTDRWNFGPLSDRNFVHRSAVSSFRQKACILCKSYGLDRSVGLLAFILCNETVSLFWNVFGSVGVIYYSFFFSVGAKRSDRPSHFVRWRLILLDQNDVVQSRFGHVHAGCVVFCRHFVCAIYMTGWQDLAEIILI